MNFLFVPYLNSVDQINVEVTAERVLRCLGASRKLIGFQYAEYMINQIVILPEKLLLTTKNLYPETAKHFGVSAISVERATRTLISSCWKYENHAFLDYIAGKPLVHQPTNSDFLDMVASYLQTMCKHQNSMTS